LNLFAIHVETKWDKENQSQPLVRAIRAASTRLPAPSLLIASDR
jgi:hypothetical protein